VMTGDGRFVEIQGTAEAQAFSRAEMNLMTDLAEKGCRQLFEVQAQLINSIFALPLA
jgi:ribonuclease PH